MILVPLAQICDLGLIKKMYDFDYTLLVWKEKKSTWWNSMNEGESGGGRERLVGEAAWNQCLPRAFRGKSPRWSLVASCWLSDTCQVHFLQQHIFTYIMSLVNDLKGKKVYQNILDVNLDLIYYNLISHLI